MSDPVSLYHETVEHLADGRDVKVIDDLARLAIKEESGLRERLDVLQTDQVPDIAPVEQFLSEQHCEELFAVGLALVAYGSKQSHVALSRALNHLARPTVPGLSGYSAYLFAGIPVIGRLVWGLVAQAVATGSLRFIPHLQAAVLPEPNESRRIVHMMMDRRLRYSEACGGNGQFTFEHYRDWLDGLGWLDECSPYLASDRHCWLSEADLILCLRGVREEGHQLYSAAAATREPVRRLVGLLGSHPVELAAILGVETVGLRDEVVRLWGLVQAPGHTFDRMQIEHLLGTVEPDSV